MENHFDSAAFLFGLASKSLVLLTLTAACAYGLRRRSASFLHGVWTVGLGACLAIPVVSWLSPRWEAPLLPTRVVEAPVAGLATRPITTPPLGGDDGVAAPRVRPRYSAAAPRRGAPAKRSTETPMANATVPVAAAHPALPSLSTVLLAVWLLGVAAVLVRLLAQVAAVQRLNRRATKLDDDHWRLLCHELKEQMGITKAVTLLAHPDAPGPLVTGLVRPVVVLPADAPDWSAERRRLVLLHELAHIRRYDLTTQLMAAVACACYWFNPLAWWGAQCMKRLREFACDDAVVSYGGVAADYAQTLLEIARGYRCRATAGAVAMAASPQVEGRIAAILNSTRSRAALTAKAMRALVAAAALGAAIVATCQVTSRDAEATEPPSDQAVSATNEKPERPVDVPQENEARTIIVRVLDTQGNPLPGARVYSSIWEMKGEPNFPSRNNDTDDQARAEIAIPRRLNILRLWPSKEGCVPQFMNFAEGTHEEGRLIPAEYEFRLEKGVILSGRVVDEEGRPVEGAKVQVRVNVDEPAWGPAAKPMISTWLTSSTFNSAPPRTDANGYWSIDNAPPSRGDLRNDYEFQLLVTHPDYAGDTVWGGLQRSQGVTTKDLRNGDANLVLASGVAVTGVVTGPDGAPVTKGLVVWDDRPYWATGVNETAIGADGRYETKRLAPGEYPITVLAPGFAPDRKLVTVEPGMEDLNLQLAPGNPIRIKLVDQQGAPIPGAYVGIGEWRGTEAIYNEKHSNVPNSGIPRHPNENGVYAWDWAPKDGIVYRISAEGYAEQKVTLVAKSTPHVITLAPRRIVVGRVTDAATGETIDNFQAMPVIVFRPDFYHTRSEDAKLGRAGQYELPLTGSGDPTDRYRVRFEAKGYRSFVSEESFGPLDGRATLDVTMEKAPAREGQVLNSAGQPVVGAVVLAASPTDVPSTSNGQPASYGSRLIPTNDEGRFQLAATTEPTLVRVYHEQGFAERSLTVDEPTIGAIRLQPWAMLSGVLLQGDQPVADQSVYFTPLVRRGLLEPRFQDSYYSRTDEAGRFHFDRLPPVAGELKALLGPWRDSPLSSSESIPIQLSPGEHREATLNGDGATITGRIVATGRSNDNLSKQWSLNYLISRKEGLPYPEEAAPLSFDPSGPLLPDWLRQPDFQSWVATRHSYYVKLADNGGLRIHGVPPGRYDLVIQLYEEPAGCLVETIGEKVVPVTVTSDGDLELGEIDVPCRIGPRIGSDMRAYEFTDADGRVRLINDLEGRHVLLHAWATWCAPCIDSMPSLKTAVERHAGSPLTVVGLNVDEDAAAARALASAQGLDWAQNYLGTDSELMRQLAVSSVPAYYLIGPDGKLVGSANQWEEIEPLLTGELD